jgi:hypothetical protein
MFTASTWASTSHVNNTAEHFRFKFNLHSHHIQVEIADKRGTTIDAFLMESTYDEFIRGKLEADQGPHQGSERKLENLFLEISQAFKNQSHLDNMV